MYDQDWRSYELKTINPGLLTRGGGGECHFSKGDCWCPILKNDPPSCCNQLNAEGRVGKGKKIWAGNQGTLRDLTMGTDRETEVGLGIKETRGKRRQM